MTTSNKIRVAVLFGGRSAEHEVSLKSAANVIKHLDPNLFEVVPIGIDKQGNWLSGRDVFLKSLEHNHVTQESNDHSTSFTPIWVGSSSTKAFDVVFPVVHGTHCEDGTLQGLLELAALPYVGCGVLSSALNMDKDISKRLAAYAGIRVADYLVVKQAEWVNQQETISNNIASKLHYPVFVKPVNTGSSIGVSKVKSKDQLSAAMNKAFTIDTRVIVEKSLNVLELELAVLESLDPNEDPMVSVVGEIVPKHEFYSYDAKYTDQEGAELLIPASVSNEIQTEAQRMAKRLFNELGCEGMARVDLFYDKDSKQLYFNEINTIPGFTAISMYPKLMSASGVSYQQLLTHLIQLAINRHQTKSQLTHRFME